MNPYNITVIYLFIYYFAKLFALLQLSILFSHYEPGQTIIHHLKVLESMFVVHYTTLLLTCAETFYEFATKR